MAADKLPVAHLIRGEYVIARGRGVGTGYRTKVEFSYRLGANVVLLDFQDGMSPSPVDRAQLWSGLHRLAYDGLDDTLRVGPTCGDTVTVTWLETDGVRAGFRFDADQVRAFLDATVALEAPALVAEAEMCRSGRAS